MRAARALPRQPCAARPGLAGRSDEPPRAAAGSSAARRPQGFAAVRASDALVGGEVSNRGRLCSAAQRGSPRPDWATQVRTRKVLLAPSIARSTPLACRAGARPGSVARATTLPVMPGIHQAECQRRHQHVDAQRIDAGQAQHRLLVETYSPGDMKRSTTTPVIGGADRALFEAEPPPARPRGWPACAARALGRYGSPATPDSARAPCRGVGLGDEVPPVQLLRASAHCAPAPASWRRS